MARHWITVHHHANRKVVWFPPISDPDVLFEGIRKHGVDYIVVVRHSSPYYLPDDDYCFERLLQRHSSSFRLALVKGGLRVFEVQRGPHAEMQRRDFE